MQRLTHDADVTVIGGGPAGVAAAIAAARNGARVALINNRPVLGGNSSSEVRVWIVGATAHGAQKFARETGIMGELFLENQWRNPEGNPILWDHVLLDAVRAEERITLFLNTDVHEVDADGPEDRRMIRSVTGWQSGSEKLIRFESPVFIDCTGDGLVGYLAGARFMSGREDRAAHGEDWAPETADGQMLGSTILFYTKDTGAPVRFIPPGVARDIVAAGIPIHRHIDTAMNGCDYWWIEWGGERDAVDDNEDIRDELWGVVFGIWDHIKNSGEFDADTLTLEWVGTIPGKREYRRFVGDHVLTQQDILEQTRFPDNVGFGGWSIDLHPPGGVYSDDAGSRHLHGPGLYEIPFRSLYSVNVSNMLMAGRDISATHVAFGTTRVMATCAVTGEAAGTGAALAVRHGVTPRELVHSHRAELQRTLIRQDASVLGIEWDDPADLALTAEVTASTTARELASAGEGERIPLADVDFALLLPVDPRLDTVTLGVHVESETTAVVELWGTRNGLNHIPVDLIMRREVVLRGGDDELPVRCDFAPDRPQDVVVLVRRNPSLAVVVGDETPPYGVLGLFAREPGVVMADAQTNEWSARELRRRSPRFRAEPVTAAYEARRAVGGLARPFAGPQLWCSETLGEQEWLRLDWHRDVSIARIELIFNDDVDEDLINLHHHTTPFPVMPELVRDYRIEMRDARGWREVVRVADNRVRRRVHDIPSTSADALRLVVTATNGASRVMMASIRVFG
jgi:hypothetical protein